MPVNPCQNGTCAIPNGPFNLLVIGFTASEVGSIVSNFHGRETTEVIACRLLSLFLRRQALKKLLRSTTEFDKYFKSLKFQRFFSISLLFQRFCTISL